MILLKRLLKFLKIFSKKKNKYVYNWRKEAILSVCEIYYIIVKAKKGYGSKVIDLRQGSDFNIFINTYMLPLEKYKVWKALFPNKISAQTSYNMDEAVKLLLNYKLVDMISEGNVITVSRIICIIKEIRFKYYIKK